MKNKRTLKIVSLILAIVMAISIMPLAALASEEEEKDYGTARTVVFNYPLTQMILANDVKDLTGGIKKSVQEILAGKLALPDVKITLKNKTTNKEYEMDRVEGAPVSNVAKLKSQYELFDSALQYFNEYSEDITTYLLEGLNSLSTSELTAWSDYVFVGYEKKIPEGDYTATVEYYDKDGYIVSPKIPTTYDFHIDKQGKQSFGYDRKLTDVVKDQVDSVTESIFGEDSIIAKGEQLLVKEFLKFNPLDLVFTGIWTDYVYPEFSFTNVDLGGKGVVGTKFLMVNRDEMINLLHFVEDIGETTFNAALGYVGTMLDNENTLSFQKTVELLTSVASYAPDKETIPIQIDYQNAYKLVETMVKIVLAGTTEGAETVADGFEAIYESYKKYGVVLPAMLEATSDTDGVVTFDATKNITLVWIVKVFQDISNDVAKQISTDGTVTNEALETVLAQLIGADYASSVMNVVEKVAPELKDVTDFFSDEVIKAINEVGYYMVQGMGLVGDKLQSGAYILMNIGSADGFFLNPMAYTIEVTWDRENSEYAQVADLGVVGPYFASDWYTFIRNNSAVKLTDSYINLLKGSSVDIVYKTLNESAGVDVTAEMITFFNSIIYRTLGGDKIYNSEAEEAIALTKFLYANGRTMQNLMQFANEVAVKSKAVYTGTVNTNWYYYSMKTDLLKNASDVLGAVSQKVQDSIVKIDDVETVPDGTGALTDPTDTPTYTPGSTVKEGATAVTTAVKNVTTAVKTVTTKAVTATKNVFSVVSKALSKLFSK